MKSRQTLMIGNNNMLPINGKEHLLAKAISLKHYTDAQIGAKVAALFTETR